MRELSRIIRDHRIDIVNAHHFMPFAYAYYGAKAVNRCRLVYTEHSASDVFGAGGKWQTIGRYLGASADAVVGVSSEVAATLTSHFSLQPGKVHTIENGVDVQALGVRDQDRTQARERWGYGPEEVVIGHVANFRRNKNHVFLLNAFRDVLARHPNVRLVLVGQGFSDDPENSEPEVRSCIRAHGLERRVSLLGYQRDVADLLHAFDVFCLVSHKEGLPLALIEAMAAGLPTVGTDIAGIRAVIQPDVTGLMVAPDDVSSLAAALTRLVADRDLRERMGKAARAVATRRFTLKRCVEDTQRLFLSLTRHELADTQPQAEGVV